MPCSPINRLDQVFADPQVKARDMVVTMRHSEAPEPISLLANPIKYSATPIEYRRAPPTLGQHTDEILTRDARSRSRQDREAAAGGSGLTAAIHHRL